MPKPPAQDGSAPADPGPPYDEIVFAYERAGNFATALDWTDRAAKVFGGAQRWKPPKIRLLRKVGRVSEASSVTLDCSVNTPDWRRMCQEANQTPRAQIARPVKGPVCFVGSADASHLDLFDRPGRCAGARLTSSP